MSGEIVVLVTSPPDEADKIASQLVEDKLAACVSVLPNMRSTYRWKGEVCKETESLLLIKSHKAYWSRLESRIRELHSYEVPEIISIDIESGHTPYLDWLRSQLEGAFR